MLPLLLLAISAQTLVAPDHQVSPTAEGGGTRARSEQVPTYQLRTACWPGFFASETFVFNGSDMVLSAKPSVIALISASDRAAWYQFIPPKTYRFYGLSPQSTVRFDYCGMP